MGLLRLIRGMDTKKMRATARRVAKEAGRPTAVIFCDMVWCGLRYQSGYVDYDLFHFWDLNAAQRATVLTRGKNNRYVAALNRREDWKLLDEKPLFFARFHGYMGRRWLDLTQAGAEQLRGFGLELGRFVVKPRDGAHGIGVEILDAAGVEDWPALYDRLCREGRTLCEEVIPQHPDLSAIWPGSINTTRIITILKDDVTHPIAACLRVGNGARPVDNFDSGGMVVPVDKSTGRITGPARDKSGKLYDRHPATGTRFEGCQLPLWPQVLDLVCRAARELPTVRYVGWDVAITPSGPVLVEANQFPGNQLYCLPGQNPDKIGILPEIEKVVPYKSL